MATATISQAAALYHVSNSHLADLCRSGVLSSARKEPNPLNGQLRWMLDPDELPRVLVYRPNIGKAAEEPWSPRYHRARDGEPTDVQYSVIAGEDWHELLDMRLREDGSLWTKWSDGERFVILPNGEMDEFQYVRVGAEYRQHERDTVAA